jgi:uncharacterized surface protein with fasciclin (FAS1) repeats
MKNAPKTALVTIFAIALFAVVSSNAFAGDKKSSKNIVETAVAAGNFNTLAKALTETGLVEELQKEGPFTVFAPTDEAFSKLPEGTLENLLKDKEALKKVLLYHVVSGKVMASDVVNLQSAATLEGNNVKITINDGNVMINNAKIIKADVVASNGVIHVIDTVLIPDND